MKLQNYDPSEEVIKEEDVDKLKTYFDGRFDKYQQDMDKTVKSNYNKIRDQSKKTTDKSKIK